MGPRRRRRAFLGHGAHRERGAVAALDAVSAPIQLGWPTRVSGCDRGIDPFTPPCKGAAEAPSARRKVGAYARARRKEALGDRAGGGSRADRPSDGGRVRRLERRRRRRLHRGRASGQGMEGRGVRGAGRRGLLRLPGEPSHGVAGRRRTEDHLADDKVVGGQGRRRQAPRSRTRPRYRTVDAVALVLQRAAGLRPRAGRGAGRHHGRAARRHPAHTSGPGQRCHVRRGPGAADGSGGDQVRGPHGHRRHPPGGVHARGRPGGLALGGGAALCRRSRRTRRRRWPS